MHQIKHTSVSQSTLTSRTILQMANAYRPACSRKCIFKQFRVLVYCMCTGSSSSSSSSSSSGGSSMLAKKETKIIFNTKISLHIHDYWVTTQTQLRLHIYGNLVRLFIGTSSPTGRNRRSFLAHAQCRSSGEVYIQFKFISRGQQSC